MTEEEIFDLMGNMPGRWFESAMDLLKGSAELSEHAVTQAEKSGIPFTRSFWPRIMLRAFALECLFKAHYLLRGPDKLCQGGKYVGVVKNERHDLALLAKSASVTISDAEEQLLDRLSAVAVSVGRYPIAKSANFPKRIKNGERLRLEWSSPRDEQIFKALRDRLIAPFDPKGIYRRILKDA